MAHFFFLFAVWFDVQREGKVGYHEAQVIEIDFKSNVKRVKFHFWKLSIDRDEWVEVGSPRIAPHVSESFYCEATFLTVLQLIIGVPSLYS